MIFVLEVLLQFVGEMSCIVGIDTLFFSTITSVYETFATIQSTEVYTIEDIDNTNLFYLSDSCGEFEYSWNQSTLGVEEFLVGYGMNLCDSLLKLSRIGNMTTSMTTFDCQCEGSCLHYGTCCYDMGLWANTSQKSLGCIEEQYLSIDECPPNWQDDAIRNACEYADNKSGYQLPVTQYSTNLTFRNKHCAACHGVDVFSEWESGVTCIHFQNVYTAVNQADFIRLVSELSGSECLIYTVPPSGFTPPRCLPQRWLSSTVVDHCKTNGFWRHTTSGHDTVEVYCARYRSATFWVMSGNAVYQNIFCAICNDETVKTQACITKVVIEPSINLQQYPTFSAPFTFLLGLHRPDDANDKRTNSACLQFQWIDFEVSNGWLLISPQCMICLFTARYNSGVANVYTVHGCSLTCRSSLKDCNWKTTLNPWNINMSFFFIENWINSSCGITF